MMMSDIEIKTRRMHLNAIHKLRGVGLRVNLEKMGLTITAENKRVRLIESKPLSGRTWYYVENKEKIPVLLGTIEYLEKWEAYSFFPENNMVFSDDCLKFIASFIEKLKSGRDEASFERTAPAKRPKKLTVDKGRHNISLDHLDDESRCHILTMSFGEVTGVSLNRTEVKRVINWLNRWVKFKEASSEQSEGMEMRLEGGAK